MRIVRTIGLALAAAALLPVAGQAQAAANGPRGFNDSWFWGIKGGTAMFTAGADGNTNVTAPTVGAEWLITRSNVALNVSVEQSFFDDQSGVYDPTIAGSVRTVSISDMRRYQASLFFFPKQFGSFRPYAGVGLALNVIQNANPEGTFLSADDQSAILASVEEQTSRASANFTVGGQYHVANVALFVQGSAMPTRNRFLLSGAANTYVVEAGLRYNLARAIEKF